MSECVENQTFVKVRSISVPKKQKDLLSLDKRYKLSNQINALLLCKERSNEMNESLLFENMCAINYFQSFLLNLGIKEQFDEHIIIQQRGGVNPVWNETVSKE